MLSVKSILLRYVFPFIFSYSVLLGISYIPPVRTNIKHIARTQTGKVLTLLLPDAIFISDPKRIGHPEKDSQITLAYANKAVITAAMKQNRVVNMDARLLYYEVDNAFLMPLFFFFSLLMITPISWKRKVVSLLLGGFFLYLLTSILLYVFAIQRISSADIGIYSLTEQQLRYYYSIGEVLNNANIFILPVLIWGIIALKKDDWKNLLLPLKNQ